MSDSQDAKSERARRQQAMLLQPGDGGLWNPADLQFMVDQGLSVPTGARFRAPTTAQELASWGFAGGGAGPDPMTGLDQWLQKNNMSLQDFQTKFGGLPLVFNADGTATYDPSAQRQSFSYNNPDDGLFHKLAPLALGGIATAGLGGFLPGTESIFGGAAAGAGGAMDMGVGLGGELGAWGGITPIADGVAGLGTGAFDATLNLGDFSNAFEVPAEGFNFADTFNPGLESGAVNPINTNLGAGGFNSIDQMIGSIASGGEATLGSVGAGGALGAAMGTAPLAGSSGFSLADIFKQSPAKGLASLLGNATGTEIDPGWINLAGQIGGAGIGLLGSNQQSNSLQGLYDQMTAQRAPFLNQAMGYLQDPNSYYTGTTAKATADAAARALSTQFGNPADSETAKSRLIGGLYGQYNNTINSLGSLGLGGQGIQANLGQQVAQTSGQPYAIAGNTIANMTSDNSMNDMFRKMFQQQFPLP